MKKSVVTDQIKKTKTITHYDYDAFGRRTLVQDEGGKIIRTLYDGLSFDIIREQETFADGYFTNTSDTGIAWGAVSEGDGSRYRYIGDDAPAAKEQNGYSVTATNRSSSRVALYANGQAVGVTRSSNYASSERRYFGTDLMGTVRASTTDSGSAEYYEYDVFGKPYGESVSDYAYTGKPYDPVTGMYNYGYRDYVPQTARFSTVDPIRDGNNWFAYCNNEPVNFQDLWGLECVSDITFSPDLFVSNPPDPFSGGGVWPGRDPKLSNWPVDSGRVSSEYGPRIAPVPGTGTYHGGIDTAVPNGTPVKATGKGTVSQVTNHPKYGKMVVIEMDNGLVTANMHLDSSSVKVGDKLTPSQNIGKTGNTGEWTTGGHDHFSVWDDKSKVPDFTSGKTMVTKETINPRTVLPEQPATIK